MHANQLLIAGRAILDPVLASSGFVFEAGPADRGSGGPFAQAAYVRGNHRLEFSVRWSLGEVVYQVGTARLSHEALMHASGASKQAAYPGFSDDPVDGFRHLRADLERFGTVFLAGTSDDFHNLVGRAADTMPASGFRRISDLAAG